MGVMFRVALLFLAATTGVAWGDDTELPTAAGRAVDFVKEVAPIFEAKCLKCHGPEKQKAEYRLDVKEIALKGGENFAPNILPGKSAESPLMRFVAGLDPDVKMPPKGEPLSAGEIGVLRTWIDAGAPWPESASAKQRDPLDWWSLKPLAKPALGSAESSHPIDAFIFAKLSEHELAISPEADAQTLCRRLYFDLIGLPPTPEELDAFVKESLASSGTYEALVDRLLASPRYGERWARHWLDVVHYGDTHGYDKDKPRPNAWPYRDYVIRAFNDDKPYARFVQEQIAGDVLFPDTRTASRRSDSSPPGRGISSGTPKCPKRKIDGKIARHLDRDDMVGNTIGTFCSLTVQCAQCHNHKFDPITQEDYYSLQAVFAAVDRADRRYDLDPAVAESAPVLTAQKQAAGGAGKGARGADQKSRRPDFGRAGKADRERRSRSRRKGAPPEYGYHSGIEKNAGDNGSGCRSISARTWRSIASC